jgi:carbon-monoxide dehydrogenase large subunit
MGDFGIGQGVPRIEDPRLLRGEGRYVDDLRVADATWMQVVRSPHPHARIAGIDTAAASAMPGVRAVLTGADLAADGIGTIPNTIKRFGRDGRPMPEPPFPLLASGRTRFVGDAVAIVIGDTPAVAADAAESVTIDYEPLPFVVDTAAALTGPLVWEDIAGNEAFVHEVGDRASVDRAFAGASHVARVTYTMARVSPNPMEPRSVVGVYDARDGRWTLHAGVQHAHLLRTLLAHDVFGVPETRIRIVADDVGGSFGVKSPLYQEHGLVLWAARRVGRPVRWTCTRAEGLLGDCHARDSITTAELALDGDGRFLALRVSTVAAMGAYLGIYAPHSPTTNISGIAGVYTTPHIHAEVVGVYTNTMITGPYRGAGRPEATYAIERVIDVAARQLGINPVALRRRNLIAPSSMPYRTPLAYVYDSGEFERGMDRALDLSDAGGFEARRSESAARGLLRGLGIVNCIENAGPARVEETAEIRFNPDGTVTVVAGTDAQGQGHETLYTQLLDEFLGVRPDRVRVVFGDTDMVRHGRGTFGSRVAVMAAMAVGQAAETIVEKGRRLAAHLLEASVDDIEFAAGTFRVAGTDRVAGIEDVARFAYRTADLPPGIAPGLEGSASPVPAAATYPNGCHVCEVEIDPETGTVAVVRYCLVDDVGRAVNPVVVEGQIHGGVAQGLGQVVLERVVYDRDSGQLVTGSFMDYCMPRADDIPPISFGSNDVPSRSNPLGIKGAGEAGTIGALSSVTSAIADALASRGIDEVPVPATPEAVWRLLHQGNGGRAVPR